MIGLTTETIFRTFDTCSSTSIHPINNTVGRLRRSSTSSPQQAMGQPTDETNHRTRLSYDSESDTATNSSDEFDWDYGGEEGAEDENLKAKRGRRLWLAFLKLARPIRVLLVGLLGVIILIIPLLVVNLRFRESRVKLQIYVWSLWLAVIWAASCGTYLVVDAIPPIVIAATNMIAGQAERLKSQLKVIFSLFTYTWTLKSL